jgi:hypothetical protein
MVGSGIVLMGIKKTKMFGAWDGHNAANLSKNSRRRHEFHKFHEIFHLLTGSPGPFLWNS